MPELFIITGSNGAEKSSIGPVYLPLSFRNTIEIFDGDKLFQNKMKSLWAQGIKANKEARNIAFDFVTDRFEALVEESIKNKTNFAYEGHFTNESTWNIPKKFKAEGFIINLIFFGLRDP